ncbi:MAG TPA: pantoate--beta-alanine ligase [Armatimonadota bacterium]|nr:pantoate--beta-alanine ligase [Armatimonadota bacterium]HPT97766.1 pantoate--beta-alanine ligase [Armatimonadota bacterium]
MSVTERIEELRSLLAPARREGRSIGFVPTMGYLHAGHLTLMQRAREENDVVVASIFVNPLQFGPKEDYQRYPRDLARDAELAREAGVDFIFAPSVEEMYPQEMLAQVDVARITDRLEGAARPGHFRGVATVVAKLFNIVQPDRAYFGQKDYQQLLVIRRMVRDLSYPIEVVAVPTVREEDGLAMSSRNSYLNPQERQAATVLIRALRLGRERIESGERNAQRVRTAMQELIAQEPLARLEYLSIADPETLCEQETITAPAFLSLAVFIGKTRLIDNLLIETL